MTAKGIRFLFKQPLDATAVGSISALRRAVVLAIPFGLILPPLLVGQGSRLSSEPKWVTKILNASWRDSVTIRKPNQDQKITVNCISISCCWADEADFILTPRVQRTTNV
jgi:hypothetical protein